MRLQYAAFLLLPLLLISSVAPAVGCTPADGKPLVNRLHRTTASEQDSFAFAVFRSDGETGDAAKDQRHADTRRGHDRRNPSLRISRHGHRPAAQLLVLGGPDSYRQLARTHRFGLEGRAALRQEILNPLRRFATSRTPFAANVRVVSQAR
ncbi:hypothetical protein [Tahibacter caeni]|uniref:hypothetical protein n=1 Tax=Tahibacter caeni TaxID=1453545 RepID=UPI002148B126|nr:hypothetical protein [Tahibacter caeni]